MTNEKLNILNQAFPSDNNVNNRIKELEDAIRTHRSQKADDRCIEDDDKLYEVLGDGIKCDRRVGCKEDMLKNCQRFIENRCEGGGWPSYAELENKLNKAVQLLSFWFYNPDVGNYNTLLPILKETEKFLEIIGGKDKYQPLKDQITIGLGLKNDTTGNSNAEIPPH